MTKSLEAMEASNIAATNGAVVQATDIFPLTKREQEMIGGIAAELCPDGNGSEKMRDAIKIKDELCPNAAVMQQHAIEASKILTATEDRLKKFESLGFFGRLWARITGKTGEAERATQRDLVTMQKIAWWYLTELQRQNLLQARAIVVIRNNLKDLQTEVRETNEMVGELAERLDQRLKNLEYSLEEIKWVVYLEGRKAEFENPQEYPVICALQVLFDYIKTFRDFAQKRCDESIWSTPLDIVAPIRAALAKFGIDEKFGLDRQTYTVQAFIDTLFAEEQKLEDGRRKIKEITELWDCLDGKRSIEYDYALKTVSGIAFNALYNYNEIMDKVGSSLKRAVKKDNPLEVLRETVLGSINVPGIKYTIVELASEIIGGCQVVMEMDFNKHKPDGIAAEEIHELTPPKQNAECEKTKDADASKCEACSVSFRDVCGKPVKLKSGAKFHINKEKVKAMLGDSYLTDYLPDGVSVDVEEDGDWELPEPGVVKFKKGSREVDEGRLGDNPSALGLDYYSDDGHFEGSFKVYQMTGHEVNDKEFTVHGVMVGDVGYGMAYGEKGIGAFSVMIG